MAKANGENTKPFEKTNKQSKTTLVNEKREPPTNQVTITVANMEPKMNYILSPPTKYVVRIR